MRKNYKRLGDYIQLVDERNSDLKVSKLVGVTINKEFIPSVANTIGTDMTNYKIIRKDQFACCLMQVRRDKKIPIALFLEEEPAIITQAYPVFEIVETHVLLPEYLMMWFSRVEFDRQACFHAVGGVRGSLEWSDFCNFMLPIPDITQQQAIVDEYQTIERRIQINEELCQKLEETAQALYRKYFIDDIDPENLPEGWRMTEIKEIGEVITGKTPPTDDEDNFGNFMPFITIPDMHNNVFTFKTERYLSKKGALSQKNKTLPENSICVSCIGTAGLVTIVTEPSQTNQQINSIVCHKDFSVYYIFLTMRNLSHIVQSHGEKGSVGNNLNKQEFSNLMLVVPSGDMMKEFQNRVEPIFEVIKYRSKETHKLKELLSLLLAKMGRE
ncbi:MAG: restriction endonuclease subunit S [Ignavibacteria bacterium]|jgi:type I restriction enzyme S subunit|nr:restriction endonuclease subunit S [Ignavibacteria bacterium]